MTAAAGVRRVKILQHGDVVKDFPQGVHARSCLENLKVVRKLKRNRPLNSLRGECRELPWKSGRSVADLAKWQMSLVGRHLFIS
jgi:hypothetical protein